MDVNEAVARMVRAFANGDLDGATEAFDDTYDWLDARGAAPDVQTVARLLAEGDE